MQGMSLASPRFARERGLRRLAKTPSWVLLGDGHRGRDPAREVCHLRERPCLHKPTENRGPPGGRSRQSGSSRAPPPPTRAALPPGKRHTHQQQQHRGRRLSGSSWQSDTGYFVGGHGASSPIRRPGTGSAVVVRATYAPRATPFPIVRHVARAQRMKWPGLRSDHRSCA